MEPHPAPPPIPAVRHRVVADASGQPFAEYAHARFSTVPAATWRSLAGEGRVRWTDGSTVTAETPVESGRTLLLSFPEAMLARAGVGPFPADLDVLHHDDDIIAVLKTPGLLAYAQGLATLSAKEYAARWVERRDGTTCKLRPLHRLDRETSGVLMYAKTASADRRIKQAFTERRVAKTYWAIVQGQVDEELSRIDAPIGPGDGPIRVQQVVRPDGKAAQTRLAVIATGPKHTWLALWPETGRTHQLRVHLAHIGHPIVGDKLYTEGGRLFPAHRLAPLTPEARDVLGMDRQALHAAELTLPWADAAVSIRAPLPPDMRRFLHEHLPGSLAAATALGYNRPHER